MRERAASRASDQSWVAEGISKRAHWAGRLATDGRTYGQVTRLLSDVRLNERIEGMVGWRADRRTSWSAGERLTSCGQTDGHARRRMNA